ncbi:MAG: 4Fe-4S binding protein [Victivallales bacterium]|nr:4Fe-4S binding protein [Victivallales bacterium]
MKKLLDIIILLLLFALLCINRAKFLGNALFSKEAPTSSSQVETPPESTNEEAPVPPSAVITLEEAKELFPEATVLVLKDDAIYEVKNGESLLGLLMKSAPYSDEISGFMGPTPLLIGLAPDLKIQKVIALKNEETPPFFERVKSNGLLDAWNGLLPSQVADKQVDVISGATFSSKGVIGSMQARMAAVKLEQQSSQEPPPDTTPALSPTNRKRLFSDAVFLILIIISFVAFFRPSLMGKGRIWLLLASIIVLAIWQGRILSMAQFTVWLVNGIPIAAQWAILLLFLLSILLPIIFGKAYYCAWLCPMGAAQVLLGELNKKHKLKLAPTLLQWLQMLRTAILFGGLLAIAIGLTFDFANFEAFTIFHPQTAPIVALVIGLLSLLLSIWLPRPWCRFLCPLGELLEILRRKKV